MGAWPIIQDGYEFEDNFHIKVICDHLEATQNFDDPNRIKNLMIGLPPRCMKSLLVAVFFPAWLWAKDAKKRFMYITSTEDLATESTGLVKKLVTSDWYKEHFGMVLKVQQATKLVNLPGGMYQGFGVQSSITGRGADVILMDDLISATNAASQTELEKVNYIYDNAISSRLNTQKYGTKILIQQRLSTGDLTGHLLDREKGKWVNLVIPMVYDGLRVTNSPLGYKDPRTKEGELLWPSRFPQSIVDDLKLTLGERAFSSQYQQLPVPMVGGIFQRDWFKDRVDNTSVIYRFISVDSAISEKTTADYSSIVVGEITATNQLFIRHVRRGHWGLPELQTQLEQVANNYKFGLHTIIIESKASGLSLIQTMQKTSPDWISEKLWPNTPINDKQFRAAQMSVWCENGSVLLPPHNEHFSWLNNFEEEIFNYPNTKHDDMVDSFDQLILFTERFLEAGFHERVKSKK